MSVAVGYVMPSFNLVISLTYFNKYLYPFKQKYRGYIGITLSVKLCLYVLSAQSLMSRWNKY